MDFTTGFVKGGYIGKPNQKVSGLLLPGEQWVAKDAQDAEPASPIGQLSPTPELEGLLILRVPERLDLKSLSDIRDTLQPVAESMGFKALVISQGMSVDVQYSRDPLVAAIEAQTAAITKLAESNQSLIEAMAQSDGRDMDDMPPVTDMSGKPIKY